jgi:hypothetical protein
LGFLPASSASRNLFARLRLLNTLGLTPWRISGSAALLRGVAHLYALAERSGDGLLPRGAKSRGGGRHRVVLSGRRSLGAGGWRRTWHWTGCCCRSCRRRFLLWPLQRLIDGPGVARIRGRRCRRLFT